jgi:hypothetical protein
MIKDILGQKTKPAVGNCGGERRGEKSSALRRSIGPVSTVLEHHSSR